MTARVLLLLAASALLFGCGSDTPPSDSAEATADAAAAATADTAPPADLPDGITLVETFDGAGEDIAIPYAKYRLANGLTVVLHEDHSDPLVHVDVTYHVGSAREEAGRSGFAHFFEHMMFQGSENVADEEHFRVVSNAGGTLNGTTNSDRTNYFQTVPANQLEKVLWLEADRMGFLLPAVTQEKFEVQRETVKNERAQRVDNRPYGRVWETLGKHLYAEGHPYSWPVIGWIEDLNRADLVDLKRFFLRWYGPNNAVLTIGGDIDPRETLALVDKYFGPIERGPEVEDMTPQPAALDADRYVTLEDNIYLPALAMMVPTVHRGHPDEPALDAAAKILGQGQASLLYQRLVQTGRAVQASVSHPCSELACAMQFIVVQNPQAGESLAEMEAAVRETLEEFAAREISEDDLQKFKAGYESGRVFGLESVSGKVSTLAFFETFDGTPRGISDEIGQYLAVSREDVRRVFDQYIAGEPAVLLSVVPNGQTQLAAAEPNHVVPERTIPERSDAEELALRPVEDNFDRSQQPVPGVNPSVELPTVWEAELANGVSVLGVANSETPTVTIQAVFDVGGRDEPAGKAGLASLMGSLMGEATRQKSAAEFTEALERIGASVFVSPGMYETRVSVSTLSKNLDEAVALMRERLLEPAFEEADFDRVRTQVLEGLQQQRKSPGPLAERAASVVLYGEENPISFPGAGLPRTVEEITREDVLAFYEANMPARFIGVLVSADVSQERVMQVLAPLGELAVEARERDALGELPAIEGRTVYLVDKPEAAQSSLRLVQRALPFDAFGDFHRAQLGNFPLGGNFNSRINLNLREDKGYTYGARSGFSGGPEVGSFRVSTEVNRDATAASITEILGELERYDEAGMDAEEFDFLQNAIGQRDARTYETPRAKLGLLVNVLRYDLPTDYRAQQKQILRSAEPSDLNGVVQELLDPTNLGIVVVGDAETIGPELEALQMPIVRLDEDGARIAP
ncbi:MAG: pitrilysin family protein [Pseudomonadota bacterium]